MVEWKKLGEVEDNDILTLGRGQVISKNDMNDCPGDYPVYSSSSQNNGEIGRYGKYMFDDERITWSIDGGGKLFYRNGIKYSVTNVCGWLKVNDENKLNTKFLYYLLFEEWTNIKFDYNHKAHPSVIRNEYIIPVIPLSEQTRIVGILDTFTSSIENLKEQIAQRRKQYEYYRDQLLDLEGKEGVERIVLKNVCEVINGRAYSQPELLSEGKYRVLRVGNFFSNDSWYYSDLELENKYYCEKGDLLYAWSASFGPHIWGEEKVIYHYHIWKMNCGERLQKKFMYYWLQSEDMKKQAFTNLHGATMAHLTKALMESLTVPIFPLSEQQRIVSILDTFEASIQNLEAQLKEREKQYEYYRNKLLTFE